MPQSKKTKILVIFPAYNPHSASHYPYWYRLFHEADTRLDIAFIFESGHDSIPFKKSILQRIHRLPFSLIERFFLILQAVREGYRHIYIHYSYGAVLMASLVRLFTPVKIYYWNCEYYHKLPKDKWLIHSLKLADVLVTGSVGIGHQFAKVFGLPKQKIAIVPNFVQKVEGSQIKLNPQKIHLLFVHHLSDRKGSRQLPIIIREVLKVLPHAQFHLVGDGPDKELLIHELSDISRHVVFYGYAPQTQVAGLFQSCHMFIMPSLSEGFPRVILEAMLYQIPFVATNVGNVSEIVTQPQQAYLVKPEEPVNFAKKVVKLLKDPNAKSIAAANYAKVTTEYTLTKAVRQFTTLFSL